MIYSTGFDPILGHYFFSIPERGCDFATLNAETYCLDTNGELVWKRSTGSDGGICLRSNGYQEDFNDLFLAPGESTILSIQELDLRRIGPLEWQDFCFWATTPDQAIDVDLTDNYFCASTLISSSDELSVSPFLRLYPNPCREELLVDIATTHTASSYCVFNVLGQQVLYGSISKGESKVAINTSTLAPGNYYLILAGGKLPQTIRFVRL